MRKGISYVLILSMCLSLCSCGKKQEEKTTQGEDVIVNAEEQEKEVSDIEEKTSDEAEIQKSDQSEEIKLPETGNFQPLEVEEEMNIDLEEYETAVGG